MRYYFEYTPTIQWYEDEGDVEYTLELWSGYYNQLEDADPTSSESVYYTFTAMTHS